MSKNIEKTNARQFSIGDVVQLNSGGPLMTVTGYDNNLASPGQFVEVTWFDGNRVEHNIFLEATLTLRAQIT